MTETLMNQSLFQISSFSLVMSLLVLLVGLVVTVYSVKYMAGDAEYKSYFLKIFSLLISLICMFNVDNILAFISFWALANLFLVMLMVHKSSWRQALEMGVLAGRNFSLGLISFLLFTALCFSQLQTFSINEISRSFLDLEPVSQTILFILLLITAMTQSAQIPFHGCLASSINAPTPVSALMHAGLVNGGGYLLVKFSSLLLVNKTFLLSVFIIGSVSAFTALIWLFIKSSVKGALVASTISQMGFMFMQIGLGLFPAAISHLCMHGFFKAFHFLSASSAFTDLKIKNLAVNFKDGLRLSDGKAFSLALLIGLASLFIFSLYSPYSLNFSDSSFILLCFIFMALSEFSFSSIKEANRSLNASLSFLLALVLASLAAFLYALFLSGFEYILSIHNFTYALNSVHYLVLAIFSLAWFLMHFQRQSLDLMSSLFGTLPKKLRAALYIFFVNSSEANYSTNTALRGDYRYK